MLTLILVSFLTFVELNCENLFDCRHDSQKQDTEFLPESPRRWKPWRYWQKLNNIGKEIIACGEDSTGFRLPDIVALCEVENDSVLCDLTKRSLLRNAGYEYIMTDSPDERGLDVALLYSPFTFSPINHRSIRVNPPQGNDATRDVLYVSGRIITDDTLHVFVVHAPSRYSGKSKSEPFRMEVARQITMAADSIRSVSANAKIIVAGDFNDYHYDRSLEYLYHNGFINATVYAKGKNGAKGTYCFQGKWESLDHVLISTQLHHKLHSSCVFDAPFLLEDDNKYGGVKPRRTYTGYRYSSKGFSDHLPLVVRFKID